MESVCQRKAYALNDTKYERLKFPVNTLAEWNTISLWDISCELLVVFYGCVIETIYL